LQWSRVRLSVFSRAVVPTFCEHTDTYEDCEGNGDSFFIDPIRRLSYVSAGVIASFLPLE
jgi:hypothetical protein